MGNTHNIFICNFLFCCGSKLHRLSGLKINQEILYQYFCQFITSTWNHSICNNTSISCKRNIGCTSTNINQRNIQHSKIFWNCNINRCNWLQCHISNIKPYMSNCCIKTIYNIFRKKRYDNIFSYFCCLMIFQTNKWFII